MKNILARFFALYAIVVFIITMIPVLIYLYACKLIFSSAKFEKILHIIFQEWMGIFMPMIGCRVHKTGLEYFQKNKQYVVVINHNSLMDIPVSSPGIPAANKTLGKSSFSKMPLFGFIYNAGSVLVDRKSSKSRAESYGKMIAALHSGLHLCLYPEGTRNKTNEPLQTFHDGAFKVAIAAQVDIIPAIIKGTKQALPANKTFWLWPQKITLTFLPAIATNGLTEKDVVALKKNVWEVMRKELDS
jgi:1-acyl-sn-glycerol-3-phosphate acyltransferase